jgi:hypothetical protein
MKTLFFYLVFSMAMGPVHQASVNCSEKPVVKKKKTVTDNGDEWYQYFYAVDADKKFLLKQVYDAGVGDCNSIQYEIGDHTWNGDTLCLYTYWLHEGDPSGKKWGAKRARYYWNCQAHTFTRLNAVLYIEEQGEPGFEPLSKEEMTCSECVQERENYKQKMARAHKGRFVVGAEARALLKQTQTFLYTRIHAIEKRMLCESSTFGCRVWN